jgi:hypothetical protein
MAGVYDLTHKGKAMICLDVSDMRIKDKSEYQSCIARAKEKIRKHAPKSLLLITNVKGTRFDMEMAENMKEYANGNTPYVKASAIVGVAGLQKVIYLAVKKLTGREFYLAETMEEAKEWLADQ